MCTVDDIEHKRIGPGTISAAGDSKLPSCTERHRSAQWLIADADAQCVRTVIRVFDHDTPVCVVRTTHARVCHKAARESTAGKEMLIPQRVIGNLHR